MRNLLFILLLFFSFDSFGQIDSTIELNAVNIITVRSQYQSGLRNDNIDSAEIQRLNTLSLDQLLTNNTAITIKDYGHGQLSTVTLRGGSSYQTAVLWNGFSISSPLHGLTDLTLSDNLFFDHTTVLYGGASTLWGSGAVSGSIYLDNVPQFNRGLSFTAGAAVGSFNDLTQFAEINYGRNKYYGSIKYIHNDNTNNYTYYDENNDLKNQTHSQIKHQSVFADQYLKTGKYSVLNFRLWATFFDREIPPALQQNSSNAQQLDKNLRLSAEWKKVKENYQVNIRTAYFREKEKYNDDYLTQASNNNCKTFISEAILEKQFKLHHLQAGINNTTNLVDSSANLQSVTLNRLAFFLLYRYQSNNRKLDASVSTRKEFSAAGNSPFLYSAGIDYHLLSQLMIRSSFSKVFRYPTLNDLYWNPGGNTDLKPESGYNSEAGIQYTLTHTKHAKSSRAILNLTYYYRNINDWIIWYPSTSNIWRPQNLLKVKSRGIETSISYALQLNKISVGTIISYNYTISTNEKSLHPLDESYQKQLIYVPLHSTNGRIIFGYRKFTFTTSVYYTGYRYTTSDNSSWLDAYTILNVEAAQIFAFKKINARIFFRANNITNANYQSVENRPMPLRTFTGGISITYQNKNNESK